MRSMLSPRHAEVLDALVLIANAYSSLLSDVKAECLRFGLDPEAVTFRDEILARADDEDAHFGFVVDLQGVGRERRDFKVNWVIGVRKIDSEFIAETTIDASEFASTRNWRATRHYDIPVQMHGTVLGSTRREAALATIALIDELLIANDLDVKISSAYGLLAGKSESLVSLLNTNGDSSRRFTRVLSDAADFADATCDSIGVPAPIVAYSEIAFVGPLGTPEDRARLAIVQSAMAGDFNRRFLTGTQAMRPLSFPGGTGYDTTFLLCLRMMLVSIGDDPRMGTSLHDRSAKVIDAFEFGIRCGAISTINDEMMDRVRDSMLTVGDVLGDAPMAS